MSFRKRLDVQSLLGTSKLLDAKDKVANFFAEHWPGQSFQMLTGSKAKRVLLR